MLTQTRPLGDRQHVVHVGIGGEHALRAVEYEHIDGGLRPRAFQRADQRGGEQHVADAARDDDQHGLRWRQVTHPHPGPPLVS